MPEFEAFVDEYIDELTALAAALTGNRQDAHDVVIEALLSASIRWTQVRQARSPLAYVRSMVYSEFIDSRRRSARHTNLLGRLRARREPPGDRTNQVLDRQVLLPALQQLSPQQRSAITLRYYLDLAEPEIAEVMGCAASTVRTHLSRGLARLREDLPHLNLDKDSDGRIHS